MCHGKIVNIGDRIFRVHLMMHCQKVLTFFKLNPYNTRNAPLQLLRNTSACLVTDNFQPVPWTETRPCSLLCSLATLPVGSESDGSEHQIALYGGQDGCFGYQSKVRLWC